MTPFISVEHAKKVFPRGDVVAFEEMDLTIAEGEAVTVVGPSGCGKTTLLRCLDGLIPLSSGSIKIAGAELKEPDARVAIVFQHFGLFPWYSVEANVAYGLKVQGVKKSEWRPIVDEYIEMVGLRGFERAYPFHLSGGMRQRVGLARALVMQPKVLLMDEPFASVDAQTRELLQEELLRIWDREPRTMVFITHSIEEAMLMGDRIVVMSAHPGRVKAILDVPFGRPRQIEQVYADPNFGELRSDIWELLRDSNKEGRSTGGPPGELQ